MGVDEETVRRALRAWLAVEVLSPRVSQGGWNGLAAERGGQRRDGPEPDAPPRWEAPRDEDPTPWPVVDEQPAEEDEARRERPWYAVVLGAMPARDAFERLDGVFADAFDEDRSRRMSGDVVAASLVLDEWGVMVPDSLALASFAWGLGHLLGGGTADGLAGWSLREPALAERLSDMLSPTGAAGRPRSLLWGDLRAASGDLAAELRLPSALWVAVPCAIRVVSASPPEADILSSFYLPDLGRVLERVDRLPGTVAAYLGLRPPGECWDALEDRTKLSALLRPGLLPLARWPGPGLHPLTLLQQAAVNAIVRDLETGGLAAVNGPPGTGKTTMLRDLVAQVMLSRAERLAAVEDPRGGLGVSADLMDFAIVVASSNNAAVENVSRELPIRDKALDASLWRDRGLDYFGATADSVLGVEADAPAAAHAWGLVAAQLGNARNRHAFFRRFWWDHDWGLRGWLDQAAWPDHQPGDGRPPGRLVLQDSPPRWPAAMAEWRRAREAFAAARERCLALRAGLVAVEEARARRVEIEAALPAAEAERARAALDAASAARARMATAAEEREALEAVASERLQFAACISRRPPAWLRWRRARARAQEAEERERSRRLDAAESAARSASDRRRAAEAVEAACAARLDEATRGVASLADELGRLAQACADENAPGDGFWSQPDEILLQASPWNGAAFRAARDESFEASIRLHRAFIVAGARWIKTALHTIARSALGGPDAPVPTQADWGVFFLVVPVVSTTFASFGRMFRRFGGGEIGWVLIDEGGQATPQAAVGAIWRARRAVVIGDPLQIEPVATLPARSTRLVFAANGVEPSDWAAPAQSAQTLADRASAIVGRFRGVDGMPGGRVTGMPLLVHRRCERPMFEIANRIAYDGRMVFATGSGASPVAGVLGPSGWIDVDAPSSDKWVRAEGELIVRAVAAVAASVGAPDLYVICPFRMPARRLRELLDTRRVLPGLDRAQREEWIARRVGTVHTFQGKEAEAVIVMLGAGRGAKPGSRAWAGATPNLLNVAATRAKRALYVVGNHALWREEGVLAEAAALLRLRSADEWRFDRAGQGGLVPAIVGEPDGRTAAVPFGGSRKVRAPRNDGAG